MGSGGGGSASGAIDFPAYMKTWHEAAMGSPTTETVRWTTGTGTEGDPYVDHTSMTSTGDVIAVNLTEAMNYALDGSSPYAGAVLLDADDVLLGGVALSSFTSPFSYLQSYAALSFDTLFALYKNTSAVADFVSSKDARIAAIVAAEAAVLQEDLDTNSLPKLRAGMRDIGACLSSAMVIAEANLMASKTRTLAKYDANLRWEAEKFQVDLLLRVDEFAARTAINAIEVRKGIVAISTDMHRLYATMHTELLDFAVENSAKDKLWDVKVFQYGGNFLGSIAGSAVSTDKGDSKGSKLASTAGMGMAGAAAGGYIGGMIAGSEAGSTMGPVGAVVGAVVGVIAGLLS